MCFKVQPVESNGESAINDNRPASLRQSINSDESYVSIRPGAQQNVFRLPNIFSRSNDDRRGDKSENDSDKIEIEDENLPHPKKKYQKKKRSNKQRNKKSMRRSKKKKKQV
jgi:hypothetical protein